MWLLKLILFVALAGVLVVVALANGQRVDVQLFGTQVLGVQLFVVMFAASGLGFLLGLAFLGVREMQWRVSARRQRRDRESLEREIRDLRRAPLTEARRAVEDHPSHPESRR